MPITPSAVLFLAITGLVLPLLAWTGRKRLEAGPPPPALLLYCETAILQAILFTFALFVMRANGIVLPTSGQLGLSAIAAGGGTLVVALGAAALYLRFAAGGVGRVLTWIAPRQTDERVVWTAVSAIAGIAEETIYRGAMFALLSKAGLGFWTAAGVTSVLFGLAHLIQGWSGAIFVTLFGLGFQFLVFVTGSIYVAMIVHFAYDLIIGLAIPKLEKQWGNSIAPDI